MIINTKSIIEMLKSRNIPEVFTALNYCDWYVTYLISGELHELAKLEKVEFDGLNNQSTFNEFKKELILLYPKMSWLQKTYLVQILSEIAELDDLYFFKHALFDALCTLEKEYLISSILALKNIGVEIFCYTSEHFNRQINAVHLPSCAMEYLREDVNPADLNNCFKPTLKVNIEDEYKGNYYIEIDCSIDKCLSNAKEGQSFIVLGKINITINKTKKYLNNNLNFMDFFHQYFKALAQSSATNYKTNKDFTFQFDDELTNSKINLCAFMDRDGIIKALDSLVFKVSAISDKLYNAKIESYLEELYLQSLLDYAAELYPNEQYSMNEIMNLLTSENEGVAHKGMLLADSIINLYKFRKIFDDIIGFSLKEKVNKTNISLLEETLRQLKRK